MRKTRKKHHLFSCCVFPYDMAWHKQPSAGTWKCFAFHPRVIFVKLARQSGNLWFDCVYVVLRDSSEEQFLTIADCSKKSCKRNLVLRKILAFGLEIAFHAILRDLDRTAFLALLCVGKIVVMVLV